MLFFHTRVDLSSLGRSRVRTSFPTEIIIYNGNEMEDKPTKNPSSVSRAFTGHPRYQRALLESMSSPSSDAEKFEILTSG